MSRKWAKRDGRKRARPHRAPQKTPVRPQKQRITMVRWPILGAPVRTQRTPKGPPRHPWGTEGAAKTAPNKNSEPLDKKRRGQEKDNKNTPQIRSPFTRVLCSSPSGGLFGRRRGAKKTQKPSFYHSFGPQGVPKRWKTLYFTKFREHTPVTTKAFGTDLRRDLRPGAPLGARPQPQNTT